MRAAVTSAFEDAFGSAPEVVVRSPGRVNLIGEHTDYNGGFVLPIAIDQATWLAAAPRRDRSVVARSLELGDGTIDLDDLAPTDSWLDYVAGSLGQLDDAAGLDLVVGTEIAIGAGLSSSAALEIGVLMVAAHMAGASWEPTAAALAAQRAENEFVGVSTGIMDQLAVAAASPGHALLIDCRSLDYTAVPIGDDVAFVICDTGTRRRLTESGYDDRRAACERAAVSLGVTALRDATPEQVEAAPLTDEERKRARHVVTENDRVELAAAAMRSGLPAELGALMAESHLSMRDDFEISSVAMDAMVELATDHPGCWGARLTGGGFAGCVIAVVEPGAGSDFVRTVGERYDASTSNRSRLYPTSAGAPAAVI